MTDTDPIQEQSSSSADKTMYEKYQEVWTTHRDLYGPKTALLYQVGGFFEIYDTENPITGETNCNIRTVAEICQLSLSQGPNTLFGGFPVDSLEKYEQILVNAGWTVVVVTQRKNRHAGRDVIHREVDHISSPGMFLSSTSSSSSTSRNLIGVLVNTIHPKQRAYWGVTSFELSTGRITFCEGNTPDRLHQFLCLHPPTEMVVWSDGLEPSNQLTEVLASSSSSSSFSYHLKCLPPSLAAADEAILERFWNLKELASWIHRHPHSRRCLAALMSFVSDHFPSSSALKDLDPPELWVPDDEVRVGNAALSQLGADDALLSLLDKCITVAGRRLLRSRLLRPITDIRELNRRLDRIDAVMNTGHDAQISISISKGLRSVYDIARLWRRLEIGASMNDMSCLLRSYESAINCLGYVDTTSDPGFFDWLFSRWDTTNTVELARAGTTPPVRILPFRPRAYPVLEELFAEGLAIRAEAQALCDSWSTLVKVRNLQKTKTKNNDASLYLDDNRTDGGFRIIGTANRISSAYTNLRNGGDLSAKVTAFKSTSCLSTARLEELSSQHSHWWITKWVPAWNEHWTSAIAEIVARGRIVSSALEAWCAELDVSWCIGQTAHEWKWVRPVFGADSAYPSPVQATTVSASETDFTVSIKGLRHPVIERLIKVPYVSHDLELGPTSMLLYGMNASGKSSLMKAIGIAVLLAQTGFPVPATAFTLSQPFTAIFTRILGNDNLWAGLSSFAVEMTEFREILQFADDRSLVLGDELCSGTESLSATALVAAGIETLADRGTVFVFATHLHTLADIIPSSTRVRIAHMKVVYDAATDTLVYDRSLAPGVGSALYGLEVCRALRLPTGFLDRAIIIRKQLEGWVAPHRSVYSSGVVVSSCEVCGGHKGLETHHIIAQAEGGTDTVGNLVCLCQTCHDDHHGGRIQIHGWKEDATGARILTWVRPDHKSLSNEVVTWIREQKLLKIRGPIIQRMGKQIFGIDISTKDLKSV